MPFKTPNVTISSGDATSLKENRKKAAAIARGGLSKDETEAETIADKCCFYFKNEKLQKKRCEKLLNLPNDMVQMILKKIFLEGKACAKHIDAMVLTLLNPKVTEFNYLSMWEYEERRGFEKFADLCQKCPKLEKLRTLEKFGGIHNLYPQFEKILSDVILQKNLTELALYGYACSVNDLWTIQKNLPKLEHLEVVLAKAQMEIADPLAGMSNLKRLHLQRSDTYEDRVNKTSYVDILVECGGRIKSLEVLIFKCKSGKLFIENYAARFPQKRLHVDKVDFEREGLSIPWPNFLTCDSLELKYIRENLVIENFASITFPVKKLIVEECLSTYIHQLLDILGKNLEHLNICAPAKRESLYLDEVMQKCPKVDKLELHSWDCSYSYDDDSSDESPLNRAHFCNIRELTLGDVSHEMPIDDCTVRFYGDLFMKTLDVVNLHIEYVVFSKAALQAMAEDSRCFAKVEKMFISTYFDDDIDDSMLVFDLARQMMSRSPYLKEIYLFSYSYTSLQRYQNHCTMIQKMAKKLEASAKKLGIKMTFDEEDEC